MYGPNGEAILNESSSMKPCSPYAVSKLACYEMGKYYRRAYGIDVKQGISFNHESPFRHDLFVTRKITQKIA
jgi:GDPmannose 4,6-dehydratase